MTFVQTLLRGLQFALPFIQPPATELDPCRHTLAAFEQGDWLAELDLLQLAQRLQLEALKSDGYDARAFDLMVAIAEVLESDHGWTFEQSEAWLTRMGLWSEEL